MRETPRVATNAISLTTVMSTKAITMNPIAFAIKAILPGTNNFSKDLAAESVLSLAYAISNFHAFVICTA